MFKARKDFIDFRTLTVRQLSDLSRKWENDARAFELKLQRYMLKAKPNDEKVDRLWNVGKSLWRRVEILERWKLHNKK